MNAVSDCLVTPLPMYAFLAVEGERAIELLQGQLTCDLRDAGRGRVLHGAWCSIKGRVIASALVWAEAPERVLLRLRADLADATAAGLGRYAALSRVTVRHAQPSLACIGLAGQAVRHGLQQALGAAPSSRLEAVATGADAVCVQRDAAGTLFELWLPAAGTDAALAALRLHGTLAAEPRWRHALAAARLAEVETATRDQFLPQMLGYDSDGTVSFRKGCYAGQEVVARAHYKGAVKRTLTLLRGGPGACPAPGAELFLGERAAGTVIESGAGPDGMLAVLAVLGAEAAAGEAPLRTADGLVLQPVSTDPVL